MAETDSIDMILDTLEHSSSGLVESEKRNMYFACDTPRRWSGGTS